MKTVFYSITVVMILVSSGYSAEVEDYLQVLRGQGQQPAEFVREQLIQHDLLILDDGLHAAVEPFEFITDYLRQYPHSVDVLFLEVIPINVQADIDSFMHSEVRDTMLLAPVFQEDFRYGWPYETYLDLFCAVWEINHESDADIRIVGVNQPIYWEGLHTREDYNTFQKSLIGRDYFMYKTILGHMNGFESGLNGLFMTNTRHAYKCIRDSGGDIYWNSGTFFHQWHPGQTFSIRFHNMSLNVKAEKNMENASMEGMDRLVYEWIRLDDGRWDQAFEQNANQPVAVPFEGNGFGETAYTGNHSADALPRQTQYDAYDALIFLKPLEETRFSAHTKFYYTDAFKKELKHRVRVMHGHDLERFLIQNNVETVTGYVEKLSEYRPETPNPLVE
ncbi:MAG: hypothetical protein U5R06_08820 [candidate division KSB1 bacterium]|nr:hypothetical protein [candidate division KSB1 bacterium]